jgi:hypothetical protein
VIPVIFDHTALLALGSGHPALSGFVVDAAAGRAAVHVPALCLTAAEAARRGLAEHIGSLPGLEIEPLGLSAALASGALISDHVDWRISHAVYTSRPSAAYPTGRVVLSTQPDLYAGRGVDVVDPGLAD